MILFNPNDIKLMMVAGFTIGAMVSFIMVASLALLLTDPKPTID